MLGKPWGNAHLGTGFTQREEMGAGDQSDYSDCVVFCLKYLCLVLVFRYLI